jgi:hypothetical protein
MTGPQNHLHVDERVLLKTPIPELGLQGGESGYVCSVWFSPSVRYEVEFQQPGLALPIRALLLETQIGAAESM